MSWRDILKQKDPIFLLLFIILILKSALNEGVVSFYLKTLRTQLFEQENKTDVEKSDDHYHQDLSFWLSDFIK